MEIENNHHVLRGNPSVPNELIKILDVEERSYFLPVHVKVDVLPSNFIGNSISLSAHVLLSLN